MSAVSNNNLIINNENYIFFKQKPKIGLLGLMTDGYEPIFPGITKRQENYANEIVQSLSPVADVYFPGAAKNRNEIEMTVKKFNEMDLDGILIILLTYSQGTWVVHALQDNKLPIAMAIVQPDQEVKDDWEELDLTVNQGIHGAQDNANAIIRAGIKCQFFAGNRHQDRFKNFVEDFAKAAKTRKFLRNLRTAVIGRMSGMSDILTDDMAFYRKIGPEPCHDTIGSVYKFIEKITDEEIKASIKRDYEIFDVDSKLSYESHAYATKLYLGFKKYLENNHFGAFTAQFDIFAADGRFKQLPLMAASHLMADGYGYAAEGDFVCASMVAAAHCIGNVDGNFTEMYTMDFSKNAIIFCHAGEGNWATHRKDMKPKLIDRYLGEGGLENPPTPIFTPQYGPATLTSLASIEGNKFRLIIAKGEILPKSDMHKCEMPYIFFRPESGIEACVENWVKNAGTHHEVINLGNITSRWKMLCDMLDIEYFEV
jgi:L-arabinose isomerase